MKHLILLILFCAVFMFALPISAAADYIPPGDVQIKTDSYKPSQTSFEKGTYVYEVSWQGIPVGKAIVAVEGKTAGKVPLLKVKATAKTASFIDIFYKLRHVSESTFNANSFKPRYFYTHQTENSREKLREISFKQNGEIQAKSVKNGKQSQALEFHSDNLTLDPISAAFVARSLPLELGKEVSFDVFNGKHRYLISFLVEGKETIKVDGKKRETFKVVPSVIKLTDTEGEKRLKSATIWVSADPNREVLKLESKVLVGKVNAKLVKFVPQGQALPKHSKQIHAKLPSTDSANLQKQGVY